MKQPTVGSLVHYQAYGTPGGEFPSVARAAIITEVPKVNPDGSMRVGLCVLNPAGMFFNQAVPFSAEPKPGHWSWPQEDPHV